MGFKPAKALILLFFLVSATPAFSLDLKSITEALEGLQRESCGGNEVHTGECKLLREKLEYLEDPNNESALDFIAQNYPQMPCGDLAVRVAQSWLGASQAFEGFEPLSILKAILCIEKGLPKWQAQCDRNPKKEFVVSWSSPKEQCSLARPPDPAETADPKSEEYQEKYFPKLGVALSGKCENTTLFLFKGKGWYKEAHKLYHYQSWKDLKHRVELRYRDKSDLDFADKMEVLELIEKELLFNKRIEHRNIIGVPSVEVKFGKTPDQSSLLVRSFDEELGQLRSKMAPLSLGGWQQVASQINAGLVFLHSMGYLHQDLKPENYLVSYRNDPNAPSGGTCGLRIGKKLKRGM